MSEPIGPTGDFPDGSCNEHDQGGIRFRIAADPMNGVVLIDFGSPARSLGMRPAEARTLARALLAKADQLDGGLGA